MNTHHQNRLAAHLQLEWGSAQIATLNDWSVQPGWDTVTVVFSTTNGTETTIMVRTYEYNGDQLNPTFTSWEMGALDRAYATQHGELPQEFGEGKCIRTDHPWRDAMRYYTDQLNELYNDLD